MVADLVLVPLRLLLDEDAGDRYYVGGAVGALRPGVEALAAPSALSVPESRHSPPTSSARAPSSPCFGNLHDRPHPVRCLLAT